MSGARGLGKQLPAKGAEAGAATTRLKLLEKQVLTLQASLQAQLDAYGQPPQTGWQATAAVDRSDASAHAAMDQALDTLEARLAHTLHLAHQLETARAAAATSSADAATAAAAALQTANMELATAQAQLLDALSAHEQAHASLQLLGQVLGLESSQQVVSADQLMPFAWGLQLQLINAHQTITGLQATSAANDVQAMSDELAAACITMQQLADSLQLGLGVEQGLLQLGTGLQQAVQNLQEQLQSAEAQAATQQQAAITAQAAAHQANQQVAALQEAVTVATAGVAAGWPEANSWRTCFAVAMTLLRHFYTKYRHHVVKLTSKEHEWAGERRALRWDIYGLSRLNANQRVQLDRLRRQITDLNHRVYLYSRGFSSG